MHETIPADVDAATRPLRRRGAAIDCGRFHRQSDRMVRLSRLYDFLHLLRRLVFPRENRTIQLLSTAAIFAIGFLLRPVGSWLIGLYADRRGRRSALTLSVILMCAGSLAIGLCPTYPQIGMAAPLVLLLARLVQGFSSAASTARVRCT